MHRLNVLCYAWPKHNSGPETPWLIHLDELNEVSEGLVPEEREREDSPHDRQRVSHAQLHEAILEMARMQQDHH